MHALVIVVNESHLHDINSFILDAGSIIIYFASYAFSEGRYGSHRVWNDGPRNKGY